MKPLGLLIFLAASLASAQEAKPGKSSAKGHCPDMRLFRIDREPFAALADQVARQGVLAFADPPTSEIDWEREDCVCTD